MADIIGAFIVGHDFEMVMGKLMGNTDEAMVWMKDAHSKRGKGVTAASPSQLVADVTNDSWEISRNAIVSMQATFSRYRLKCSRAPVSHELKWRGREGIEKGVKTAR